MLTLYYVNVELFFASACTHSYVSFVQAIKGSLTTNMAMVLIAHLEQDLEILGEEIA